MKKTNLLLAAATAAVIGLSGCAGGGPTNQQIGVGTGAVLGGVAGNALFGGTAGAVGGAAAGALVGNEVGRRSDRRY